MKNIWERKDWKKSDHNWKWLVLILLALNFVMTFSLVLWIMFGVR